MNVKRWAEMTVHILLAVVCALICVVIWLIFGAQVATGIGVGMLGAFVVHMVVWVIGIVREGW